MMQNAVPYAGIVKLSVAEIILMCFVYLPNSKSEKKNRLIPVEDNKGFANIRQISNLYLAVVMTFDKKSERFLAIECYAKSFSKAFLFPFFELILLFFFISLFDTFRMRLWVFLEFFRIFRQSSSFGFLEYFGLFSLFHVFWWNFREFCQIWC